jgi:hypothetical protein
VVIDQDDGIRRGTTAQQLAQLKPVFKKGGSTTAGNSSQVGASRAQRQPVRVLGRASTAPLSGDLAVSPSRSLGAGAHRALGAGLGRAPAP